MILRIALLALVSFSVAGEPLRAQSPSLSDEEVLQGFDDADNQQESISETLKIKEKSAHPAWWGYFSGHTSFSSAYNYAHHPPIDKQTDFRGFSMLKPEVYLAFDYKLTDHWQVKISGSTAFDFIYRYHATRAYTQEVIDALEQDHELLETYISGKLNEFMDITVGKQIIRLGYSEMIPLSDLINPTDNRQFGAQDLEDLKIPLWMSRLDFYWARWRLRLLAIHEIRFAKMPPWGSDFYPYEIKLPAEAIPPNSLENTEWVVTLDRSFAGFDLSFYGGRLFDDRPFLQELGPPVMVDGLYARQIAVRHSRFNMGGGAIRWIKDGFVVRAETVILDKLRYSSFPRQEKTRIDYLYGIEYTGLADTQITAEVSDWHIFDYDAHHSTLPDVPKEDSYLMGLRYRGDFLNDGLHFNVVVMGLGTETGGFQRVGWDYNKTDNLLLSMSFLFYQSGKWAPFTKIDANDRIIGQLRYSF